MNHLSKYNYHHSSVFIIISPPSSAESFSQVLLSPQFSQVVLTSSSSWNKWTFFHELAVSYFQWKGSDQCHREVYFLILFFTWLAIIVLHWLYYYHVIDYIINMKTCGIIICCDRLESRIFWFGLANLVFCPLIFVWNGLYFFFRYAEVRIEKKKRKKEIQTRKREKWPMKSLSLHM